MLMGVQSGLAMCVFSFCLGSLLFVVSLVISKLMGKPGNVRSFDSCRRNDRKYANRKVWGRNLGRETVFLNYV